MDIETNDFDFENRIMNTGYNAEDSDVEVSLRPKTLDEYIGQEKVKENLKIYIEAAKKRNDLLRKLCVGCIFLHFLSFSRGFPLESH